MLIKINPESIHPNSRAGQTTTAMFGNQTIKFKIEGPLPDFIVDGDECVITAQSIGPEEWYEGMLLREGELLDRIKTLTRATVEVNRQFEMAHHSPLPKYIYTYLNPSIQCEHCKSLVPVNDIEADYDDEGESYTKCPICGTIDSFEAVQYQSIEDALAEKEQKPGN